MNAEVLWAAAEVWVSVFDFEGSGGVPRTFPVKMVLDEAKCWQGMGNLLIVFSLVGFLFGLKSISFKRISTNNHPIVYGTGIENHIPIPQVTKFWRFMLQDDFLRDGPSKTKIYADAWGIKKLMSHALRNLRQDRSPRVPRWQILKTYRCPISILLVGKLFQKNHIEYFVYGFIVHLSKSKAVQHLNNIFLTGWYLNVPAEPHVDPTLALPAPESEVPDPTHEDEEDR